MTKDLIYCPVHGHSSRDSPRDGANSVVEIVEKHLELGYKSVLLTGHDSISGQRELFEQCEKRGLQARIGIEWYMILSKYLSAKDNKETAEYTSGLPHKDSKSYHQTCIVLNETGYQNLLKLKYLSALKESDGIEIDGFTGSYYKRGRVTEEMIFAMSEGLVFTSGCRLSLYNEYLIAGLEEQATQYLLMFNKKCENFFIELHIAHNEVEELMFHWLKQFAFKHNIPCVIANDFHYLDKGGLVYWNALGGLRRNKTIITSAEDMITNDDFFIKSKEEVWDRVLELNNNNLQDAIKCFSGHEILEEQITFKWKNRKAPKIQIPDAENKLYAKLLQGLEQKFGDNVPEEYMERMNKGFETAKFTGNCSYYYEVGELMQYARNKGYILPINRGSAGGLLLCYLLNITQIDPIVYGLLEERASNMQRITELDIDIDLASYAVDDIVENYLKPRYGSKNIVNVANYGVVHLPLAIRNAMKWLDYPEHLKNKISKDIKQKFVEIKYAGEEEEELSPEISAIEHLQDFKDIFTKNGISNYKEVFKYAKGYENTINNVSIHASALIISNRPFFEMFPVKRIGDILSSEFDQHDLKSLNTLKLDLLRVSCYDKIGKTIELYNKSLI